MTDKLTRYFAYAPLAPDKRPTIHRLTGSIKEDAAFFSNFHTDSGDKYSTKALQLSAKEAKHHLVVIYLRLLRTDARNLMRYASYLLLIIRNLVLALFVRTKGL